MTKAYILVAVWVLQAPMIAWTFHLARKTAALRKQIDQAIGLQHATEQIIAAAGAPDATGLFIIHKPENGCPVGWREIAGLFSEPDGTHRDGCIFESGGSTPGQLRASTDYLLGGESVDLAIRIPIPEPDPSSNGEETL